MNKGNDEDPGKAKSKAKAKVGKARGVKGGGSTQAIVALTVYTSCLPYSAACSAQAAARDLYK